MSVKERNNLTARHCQQSKKESALNDKWFWYKYVNVISKIQCFIKHVLKK